MMLRTIGLLLLGILSGPAAAQGVLGGCAITTSSGAKTDYSATIGASSTTLIPAPPAGVTRTGVFVQILTPGASVALNPSGGTASLTAAGNMVTTGQYSTFNFAGLGFVPQGAITAIADAAGRVITAYACPR